MNKVVSHAVVAVVVLMGTVVVMRPQQSVTQRFPQFENEDVKVWKSVVYPEAPLTMHRHDHPRVIIALKGGNIKIVEKTGAAEDHAWETGHAYWLPANPPGTQHADVNSGKEPIEVMVVELEKEH
jgi:hypothetical protein